MNYNPGHILKNLSTSARIYLGLVAFLFSVKLLFLLFPTAFPIAEQAGAFSWTTISAISLLGFVGLILSRRTGFPEIWDERVSNRQRFLIPTLLGLAYGVITVIHDLPNPSPIHLKLPLSIPFYTFGAIFLEILLRLFAISFLVWLVSNVMLRGRWQTHVFWLAVVVASLYEPLPRINEELSAATAIAAPSIILRWATQPLFLANVISGWLFRKYGFIAPLMLRLSFYLVWHIIYGGLISTATR
jgi:hypothetical protein